MSEAQPPATGDIIGDLFAEITVVKQPTTVKVAHVVTTTTKLAPGQKPPVGYSNFHEDAVALAEILRRLSDTFPKRSFILISTPDKIDYMKKPDGTVDWGKLDQTGWSVMSDHDEYNVQRICAHLVLAFQENRQLNYYQKGENFKVATLQNSPDPIEPLDIETTTPPESGDPETGEPPTTGG